VTDKKLYGGITIAGMIILAYLAGIKAFGYRRSRRRSSWRGNSLDISADLTELGRMPTAVINTGYRGFLDLPRTLEYMATQGVGVATFAEGPNGPNDLPALYVRDSGIKSPKTIKDEAEAAAFIYA
jgi:pseudouridylate synthase / pseudouridine kinase